eukprot:TRINITY_DN1286_c0_g1_i1.p1 TRINITY_DN1286_c0_g1~~TRINITY_DN1286_c0_g1_i1.p1  ORF type:complete len:190 (-),score=54.06 TRINITY_DN1286_c0_g1_i1:6-575(-)
MMKILVMILLLDSTVDSSDDSSTGSDTDSGSGSDSNGDGNSDSSDDSDSSDTSTDDSNIADSSSTDREEISSLEIDLCIGESSKDNCEDLAEDDGSKLCAFNERTSNCYAIMEVRRGRFGSGNFDDGFIAAQTEHAQTASELEVIIGVMGGVIAALFLVLICGGYWLFNNYKSNIDKVLDIDDLDELNY